jgi:hypothetical protein
MEFTFQGQSTVSQLMNVQGDQAPAKRQKMLKKIQELIHEDCHQTIHKLTDTVGMSYGVYLTGDLNRKFEHAPQCRKVCSPTLDK